MYFGDQFSVYCGVGEELSVLSRLPFCLTDCVFVLQKLLSFRRSHLFIVALSVSDYCAIIREWSPLPMH